MSKPIYVGVFLDEASRKSLLAFAPPKHPNVFADHITLAFGKAMEKEYPIGLKTKVVAHAIVDDEKGQAVLCTLNLFLEKFLQKDQQPHITVSCVDGVKPVYSNELISKSYPMAYNVVTLEGVVDFFPRTIA